MDYFSCNKTLKYASPRDKEVVVSHSVVVHVVLIYFSDFFLNKEVTKAGQTFDVRSFGS